MRVFQVSVLILKIFSISTTVGLTKYITSNNNVYNNAQQNIQIGLMADHDAEIQRKAFEYAILEANKGLSLPILGYFEKIGRGNSLQGYGRLCKLMQSGIVTVFSALGEQISSHMLTLSDALDLPFIVPMMLESSNSFNLNPDPLILSEIIYAIVQKFDWTRFIFLYESSEYLNVLKHIISLNSTGGPVIKAMCYDLHLNGNYKAALRQVRDQLNEDRIVILGSTASVGELLIQALQVGIINEDYKYIIGNLDLQTYNLEEYQYSGANITGLRMFSTEQEIVRNLISNIGFSEVKRNNDGFCPITLETALLFDAIQIFAETTNHLDFKHRTVNCSDLGTNTQSDGLTFYNYMRSVNLRDKTITGNVFFEGNNKRKGYNIDIIELQTNGLVKVGVWDENGNLEFKRQPIIEEHEEYDNSLVNKTFVVLISVGTKPYAALIESHKTLEGNNQYEGYGIDVIKELAQKLNFNYIFKDGGDDYGSFNKSTNTSSGMLKEIAEGRAHLAITDLTITSEREEVVDFSNPFMNLGIAILYVKPKIAPPQLWSFMDPFSSEVWIYLGLAYMGVSLSFYILGRLSPTEWESPYPCIEDPVDLENQFTVGNSLWFTTGALLQQGSEIAPRALSTRTVASIWWFFTLIMVSSYTANLAAFLTVVKPTGLIESVEDLAENKGGVQYGAKKTGSTRNFFLTSEEPLYKKMNEYMLRNPHLLYPKNEDGVKKVNSKFAFLMESTSIEYNTVRNCDLMMIGEPLDEKGYGIAMKKNWPYRDKFKLALLELQEQGVLASIKNKWWKEVGAGVCGVMNRKEDNGAATSLDFDNVGGVYLVLAVGTVLSFIFGMTHWCFDVAKRARHYQVNFKEALAEEFIFVMSFWYNERELKSTQSVYSRSKNSMISLQKSLGNYSTKSD